MMGFILSNKDGTDRLEFDTQPEETVDTLRKMAVEAANEGNVMKAAQLLTWAEFFVSIRQRIVNAALADTIMKHAVEADSTTGTIKVAPDKEVHCKTSMSVEQMEETLRCGGTLRGVVRSLMGMICQGICNVTEPGIDELLKDEFQTALATAREMHAAAARGEKFDPAKTGDDTPEKERMTWH